MTAPVAGPTSAASRKSFAAESSNAGLCGISFAASSVTLPHVAVRIKPVRQFQIRIDGGYGLYNFFFGGSIYYGF